MSNTETLDLNAIEVRWFSDELHRPEYWADLASRDVPALIAEVRRLQGQLVKIREQCDEAEAVAVAAVRGETETPPTVTLSEVLARRIRRILNGESQP